MPFVLPLLLGGLLLGCSVGGGSGSAIGVVTDPECELKNDAFSLKPTFFSAEPIEDEVVFRFQNGSDFEDKSDGLIVLVRNARDVRENKLGEALPLGRERDPADELIQMTFYLNETCPINRNDVPTVFEAVAGTITFDSIYAPRVNDDGETEFSFDNVEFVDTSNPDKRHATLSGKVRFLYARGRPAQRFP